MLPIPYVCFSQEDIAKILHISRSSVVQIEKGNRQVSAIELSILSQSMNFSVDTFLNAEYESSTTLTIAEEPEIFELHEEQFTGLLYTRQSSGPSPENITGILKEMPLKATKEGEAIDYELVFYRRPSHSIRIYDEDWYES